MDLPTAAAPHTRGPKMHLTRILTRAARLPWLRCRRCGRRLAQVDVFDGWTVLRVGHTYTDDQPVKLICPNCRTSRPFYPRQIEPPPA